MWIAKSLSLSLGSRIAVALGGLLAVVPAARAQSTEILTIRFSSPGQTVVQAIPLSTELIVGIALVVAVTGLIALRRRGGRGGRLFGWLLALTAGTMLAVISGQRVISDAEAILPPATIDLSTSPATLDLLAFWNSNVDPLTVTVTNVSGQSVKITSISVDNTNLYILSSPTTCIAGGILAPSAQCTITMSIQ